MSMKVFQIMTLSSLEKNNASRILVAVSVICTTSLAFYCSFLGGTRWLVKYS